MYLIRDIDELICDLHQKYEQSTADKFRLEMILERGESYYSGKTGLRTELAKVIGQYQAYATALEMVLAFKEHLNQYHGPTDFEEVDKTVMDNSEEFLLIEVSSQ